MNLLGHWTICWSMNYEGQVGVSVEGERPEWTTPPSPATWGTASAKVEVVPADAYQGAVAVAELADAFNWPCRRQGREECEDCTACRMRRALAAWRGSRPVSCEEDASQSRWVVGGCYEENRLRLIEGRTLDVHEQLTLVEASE